MLGEDLIRQLKRFPGAKINIFGINRTKNGDLKPVLRDLTASDVVLTATQFGNSHEWVINAMKNETNDDLAKVEERKNSL